MQLANWNIHKGAQPYEQFWLIESITNGKSKQIQGDLINSHNIINSNPLKYHRIQTYRFSTPTVVYNQSKINLFQCLVNKIFPTRLFTLNIPMIFMLSPPYKKKTLKKKSDYNLSSRPANFRWKIRKEIMNDGHWNAILCSIWYASESTQRIFCNQFNKELRRSLLSNDFLSFSWFFLICDNPSTKMMRATIFFLLVYIINERKSIFISLIYFTYVFLILFSDQIVIMMLVWI